MEVNNHDEEIMKRSYSITPTVYLEGLQTRLESDIARLALHQVWLNEEVARRQDADS